MGPLSAAQLEISLNDNLRISRILNAEIIECITED